MSQYEGQQEYWNPNQGFQQGQADSSYNFEMPVQQEFGQELSFQSFEGGAENAATAATSSFSAEGVNIYGANPYLNPTSHYDAGNMMTPNDQESFVAGDDEFADEPPLLEELGINPDFIMQKVK
ncbi:PREDICTED: uncharacterized protein LOC108569652 [Nicrophorus vespilloides]|uniref:Uncharacterized protein LOC108569652 n=1 Tax=Nicrophorus vespilloides TaxID=110193 RepID=A0ABM1NIX2_NICVS|nr:PREDICTED: uncharacterized protein LOC108569652 [Nicrophorus vespilloides]